LSVDRSADGSPHPDAGSNNILFPSNGEPSIVPSQDIVLGLYYATREAINGKNEGMMFPDVSEVIRAYDNKKSNWPHRVPCAEYTERSGNRRIRKPQTLRNHVGRAILSEIAQGPARSAC
jgi:DNA-directed RNA polymerase subunit beta'